MKKSLFILISLSVAACFISCNTIQPINNTETENHGDTIISEIKGFYLLNEGNMGSNKASIDYYDYTTATYSRNIYADVNPNVTKELGDVGNDLKIYGSRLYAVINCSNKVEVMDAATCKRIGQIDIPNCRYICFDGEYGYITSYAGPIRIDTAYEQIGYVAKFDTATLEIVSQCLVGFQPDGIEIVGNYIYVANSGGYLTPNYENTVSVIDKSGFKEIKRIEVAINLHKLQADKYGQLWVSSRGDYYDTNSKLYCIDTQTNTLVDSIATGVSNFCIDNDSLYLISTEWNYVSMENTVTYGIVDVSSHQLLTQKFITDGTDEKIKVPYGIAVNPITKEIFVSDAKNYVTPGTLFCFSNDGKAKWSVRTGDIPSSIVFLK